MLSEVRPSHFVYLSVLYFCCTSVVVVVEFGVAEQMVEALQASHKHVGSDSSLVG